MSSSRRVFLAFFLFFFLPSNIVFAQMIRGSQEIHGNQLRDAKSSKEKDVSFAVVKNKANIKKITKDTNKDNNSTNNHKKGFDSSFLVGPLRGMDLSLFNNPSYVLPGTYDTAVVLNGKSIGKFQVFIRNKRETTGLTASAPCVEKRFLDKAEINYTLVHGSNIQSLNSKACVNIKKVFKGSYKFNALKRRLEIFIPQFFTRKTRSYYTQDSLYNHGTNAAYLNYIFTANQRKEKNIDRQEGFNTNLNGGMHLGRWNIFHQSSVSYQKGEDNGHAKWNNIATYAQRNIIPLRSVFTIGDYFTSSYALDSFTFRGIQMKTDELLLPSYLQDYSPIIQGVLTTSANIKITQNGDIIYDKNFPPGPYKINDLYTNGYGDVYVTVTQSDGTVRTFTRTGARALNSLKDGITNYSVSGGFYKDSDTSGLHGPFFMQVAIARGLSSALTVFGDGLSSRYYSAWGGSISKGLPKNLGIMSLGIESASSTKDTLNDFGNRISISYENAIESVIAMSITDKQTLSKKYHSFSDVVNYNINDNFSEISKNQLGFNVSGNIKSISISANIAYETYWGNDTSNSLSTSLNLSGSVNFIPGAVWMASYMSTRYSGHNTLKEKEQELSFSFSMPLGFKLFEDKPTLTYAISHSNDGNVSNQIGLNGKFSENFSYYTNVSWNNAKERSVGIGTGYSGSTVNVNVSHTQGRNYREENFGFDGAIVVHKGGVTLAPLVGNTFAIVNASGATGTRLSGGATRINAFGYGIVPFLSPYRSNTISLNENSLPSGSMISNIKQKFRPENGSIIPVHFSVRTGRRVLLGIETGNKVIPVGAEVSDSEHNIVGFVGAYNQAFLSAVHNGQELRASWYRGKNNYSCSLRLYLPPKDKDPDSIFTSVSIPCAVVKK